MVKSLDQLSRGFVGPEGIQVKVLPKDVEGDATFGPQLINLTQLSSSPNAPLMLSEENEKHGLVSLCVCACLRTCCFFVVFFYFCLRVTGRKCDWGKSG